jgi:hypothetical protein
MPNKIKNMNGVQLLPSMTAIDVYLGSPGLIELREVPGKHPWWS